MAGLVILALVLRSTSGIPEIPPPGDVEAVALGARLYAAHCASCHGVALQGQQDWRQRKPNGRLPAPPHDRSGHTWHHSDEALFRITRDGLGAFAPPGYLSDMPAFGALLNDGEIAAVVTFIKSTWPVEIRMRQTAISGTPR